MEILRQHPEATNINAVLIDFFLYDLAKERETAGEYATSLQLSCPLPPDRIMMILTTIATAVGFELAGRSAMLGRLKHLPQARAGVAITEKASTNIVGATEPVPHHRTRSIWY